MKFVKVVLLPLMAIAIAISFISCAAIIHGSSQEVSFQTSPEGVSVEVLDAFDFSYGSCETPCSIKLKRKRDYKVLLSKPGYNSAEIVLSKKTDGWVWGNIFFGGIIGLIVDFTGGAAYKLEPGDVVATLSENTTGALPEGKLGKGLAIIDFDSLSDEEKAKVIKLDKFDIK